MPMNRPLLLATAALSLALGACGRPEPAPNANAPDATPTSAAPSAPDNAIPDHAASGGATPAAAAVGTNDGVASAHWRCGDAAVESVFDNASQSLQVQVDGKTLTLPTVESGSGARYADGQGNEFWEHQDEATLTQAGGKATACTRATRSDTAAN
jgi:membrane-bound inhibitor of C-type lysozyme